MKPKIAILLLFILAWYQPISAAAQQVDPVAELQDAALNYEAASKAQITIANSLLQARQEPVQDEKSQQKRRRQTTNASLELQASDNMMGAAANLDNASRAWKSAANATKEQAAREYFLTTARYADQQATSLIRQAAELVENAALEYASSNDLRGQSNASAKAGRIREKLSTR